MKKCVDELPGSGTFATPGAPLCPVLGVGFGWRLDSCCINSDLGTGMVSSVCCGVTAETVCCAGW